MTSPAFRQQRDQDIARLADAIVHEVCLRMGINPESAHKHCTVQMQVAIANRVLGWVNHRLGIVPPRDMAEQANHNRMQAEECGYGAFCFGDCG